MFFLLLRIASLFAVICILSSPARAADLYKIDLLDGSSVVGQIIERTGSEIVIKMHNGPALTLSTNTIASITDNTTASDNVLRLSGSTTIGSQLAPDLARAFLRSQISYPHDYNIKLNEERDPSRPDTVTISLIGEPGAFYQAVEITAEGSSAGFADLLDRETDFAMASRPINKQEWQRFANRFEVDMRSSDAEYVIGIDAIEIIVNQRNQLSTISRSGVADIYSKQLGAWNDFPIRESGLDDAVVTLGRDENSATADSFERIVMGSASPVYDLLLDSAGKVASVVEATTAAVGYVGIGNSSGHRPLTINECGIDYRSESFLVSAEDHPLSRRLYLYRNPEGGGPFATAFADFTFSESPGAGQSIVEQHFVGLSLREADDDVTAWRLSITGNQQAQDPLRREQFRSKIAQARRLSATFRFDVGGNRLDSRGERDLRAIVNKMQRESIAPERLLIFGFADSLGGEQLNGELSHSRAQVIADELRRRGVNVPEDNVLGIGEEAPIGCNYRPNGSRDEAGSSRNRRIEVWLSYDGIDGQTVGVGGQLEPARVSIEGERRPNNNVDRLVNDDTKDDGAESRGRSPLM